MILLEFLEQISGIRAIIKTANMIVTKGLWVRGQIDLSGFLFICFFTFFNEFFLAHPLLRFSSRLPFLRLICTNVIRLIIPEIELFFDISTKKLLPHSNYYWLELDFFFENNFKLKLKSNLIFYTQFFLSNNILEWRKI